MSNFKNIKTGYVALALILICVSFVHADDSYWPSAKVISVEPRLIRLGENIFFAGSGTPGIGGEPISEYYWKAVNKQTTAVVELPKQASFTCSGLPPGYYDIYFRVRSGIMWSVEAIAGPVHVLPFVENVPAQAGTVTPWAGTSKTYEAAVITATYTDPNGKDDISYASIQIDTENTGYNDTVYAFYENNCGKPSFYLYSDDGIIISSGAPGTSQYILHNSLVMLDCRATTVEPVPGDPNTLKINWKFYFKKHYAGHKNVYLQASDFLSYRLEFDSVKRGEWDIVLGSNHAPNAGAISPDYLKAEGGEFYTITARFSDVDARKDIKTCRVIMNTSPVKGRGLYVEYDPDTQCIWLGNDNGTGYSGWWMLGEYGKLENSYVQVDCERSKVSSNQEWYDYELTLCVSVKSIFYTHANIYTEVTDRSGASSGYQVRGAWDFTNVKSTGPVTPAAGSAKVYEYAALSAVYFDPDGFSDIKECRMIINTSAKEGGGLSVIYKPADRTLWLADDAGTGFAGSAPLKSYNILANSYCAIDCMKTTVKLEPDSKSITVNWYMLFTKDFPKSSGIFTALSDQKGRMTEYSKKGTWTILPGSPPCLGAVTPGSGTVKANTSMTVSAVYNDPDGRNDISRVSIHIGDSNDNLKNCFAAELDMANEAVRMADDSGMWTGLSFKAGTPGAVLENSYARINIGSTWVESISGDVNSYKVNWSVTFKNSFAGQRKIYTQAEDRSGVMSGDTAQQKGAINIAATDIPPSGSIWIKYNMPCTAKRAVGLVLMVKNALGNSEGCKVKLSKDGLYWSQWQDFVPAVDIVLPGGSGTKTVYAMFKDASGNESDVVKDTIELYDMPVMVIADMDGTGKDDLVIDIGQGLAGGTPPGIWVVYGSDRAENICPVSCEGMVAGDMDNDGKDDLVIDFGEQYGLYVKSAGGNFRQLSPVTPETMVLGNFDNKGGMDIAADFGNDHGVWIIYDDVAFKQICPISPGNILAGDFVPGGADEIIFDYGDYAPAPGTYLYMNPSSSYYLLFGGEYDTEYMIAADVKGDGHKECIVDLGPEIEAAHKKGLWVGTYAGGAAGFSWEQISAISPEIMAAGKLDSNDKEDVIMDFGNVPYYLYPNRLWIQFDSGQCEPMGSAEKMQVYAISMGDTDHNGRADAFMDFGPSYGVWVRKDKTGFEKKLFLSGNI